MGEQLIWVDNFDNIVGYGEKMYTHNVGQLHRAFSIFVYDLISEKILIQRRAIKKYHSGGLWSNSCCSHQRKNEDWHAAILRCMKNELNIGTDISNLCDIEYSNAKIDGRGIFHVGTFIYHVQLENLIEHELDHVYVYADKFSGEIPIYNKEEIDDLKWIDKNELDKYISDSLDAFTAWFYSAYKLFRNRI